jgi:hydroxymethylpyrimidine pyrophosphatase-like HAD family hydrolase
MLNIEMKETLYFGDNYNDLDLLKKVGTSAVVEDAEEDIKSVADIVVDAGYKDGVAKYIEQHFLNNK